MHLIRHSVKFLRKLSEIKGDKNFLNRIEVDVIKFRPLIKILLIKILMNGTITGLSLRYFSLLCVSYQIISVIPMILTKIMFTHKQMDNRAVRFGYIHRAVISFDIISFQQNYPDIKITDRFLSNRKIYIKICYLTCYYEATICTGIKRLSFDNVLDTGWYIFNHKKHSEENLFM